MNLAVLFQLASGDLPITVPVSRRELARAFRDLGFTKGAEIGVWKGVYSEVLCQENPGVQLACVDPWAPQDDYREDKNNAAVLEKAYREAEGRLRPYGCTLIRKTSVEAAAQVEDGSLDFVYIDGNHRYDAAFTDIATWAPKVRRGGIVAGHDFFMKPKKHIEVEKAVRDYTDIEGVRPWFVLRHKDDETPSWAWVQR